jgi:phosphoglycolate phosphatase
MSYQLVIFDFDGTLADSYPWFLSVFKDLAKRYHLPHLEDDELEKLRSFDVKQILREYKIPIWKMVLIGNHLKKLMREQIEQINMVAGMQEVIETLSAQGVELAVVTSNAETNVMQVLGPQNASCFQWIESGVAMFGKKSRFQKILKKTGIPAERTLCIGDEVRDLKSSHAAKIPFGAVTWGYTDHRMLRAHSPEEIFMTPDQILNVVCKDRN